ncbi:MAG: siderophore-interacting protein [Bauldia sp.]
MNEASAEPWKERFRGIRVVEVRRAQQVTPLMRRITLGGPELVSVPRGPNVKLLFPPRGIEAAWPRRGPEGKAIWPEPERRPVTRTYSVRRDDRTAREIDVDFVLHGHGPAARWAAEARPGDVIGIGGPGGLTVREAQFYLLAGDHSALPAIARILENLPQDAKGLALIEIPGPDEEQQLRRPDGVPVEWLHRREAAGQPTVLEESVRAMRWPDTARVFAWVGAESTTARALKAYIRDEHRLDRRQFLAMGYWRLGMSEAEYHQAFDHDRGDEYHQNRREFDAAHAD